MADRRYIPLGKAPLKAEDATITGDWIFQGDGSYTYLQAADPNSSLNGYGEFGVYIFDSGRISSIDLTSQGANAKSRIQAWVYSDTSTAEPAFAVIRTRGDDSGYEATQAGDALGEFRVTTYTDDLYDAARFYWTRGTNTISNGPSANLYFQSGDDTSTMRNRFGLLYDGSIVTYNGSGTVATGGGQGAGTINSKGLYVDGHPVAVPDASDRILREPMWTDLVIEGTAINPPGGASDPSRSTTTGLLEFSGTADNVITGCWQLPHGWAGEFGTAYSTVKPHLHVRNLTANTNTSRWKFEYDVSSAAGNMTNAYGTFTTLGTVSHVNPNDTTQISIVSLGDIDLSGTGYGASSLIHFRITRLASSDAADDDTGLIALYSMDLHYQVMADGTETVVPSGD